METPKSARVGLLLQVITLAAAATATVGAAPLSSQPLLAARVALLCGTMLLAMSAGEGTAEVLGRVASFLAPWPLPASAARPANPTDSTNKNNKKGKRPKTTSKTLPAPPASSVLSGALRRELDREGLLAPLDQKAAEAIAQKATPSGLLEHALATIADLALSAVAATLAPLLTQVLGAIDAAATATDSALTAAGHANEGVQGTIDAKKKGRVAVERARTAAAALAADSKSEAARIAGDAESCMADLQRAQAADLAAVLAGFAALGELLHRYHAVLLKHTCGVRAVAESAAGSLPGKRGGNALSRNIKAVATTLEAAADVPGSAAGQAIHEWEAYLRSAIAAATTTPATTNAATTSGTPAAKTATATAAAAAASDYSATTGKAEAAAETQAPRAQRRCRRRRRRRAAVSTILEADRPASPEVQAEEPEGPGAATAETNRAPQPMGANCPIAAASNGAQQDSSPAAGSCDSSNDNNNTNSGADDFSSDSAMLEPIVAPVQAARRSSALSLDLQPTTPAQGSSNTAFGGGSARTSGSGGSARSDAGGSTGDHDDGEGGGAAPRGGSAAGEAAAVLRGAADAALLLPDDDDLGDGWASSPVARPDEAEGAAAAAQQAAQQEAQQAGQAQLQLGELLCVARADVEYYQRECAEKDARLAHFAEHAERQVDAARSDAAAWHAAAARAEAEAASLRAALAATEGRAAAAEGQANWILQQLLAANESASQWQAVAEASAAAQAAAAAEVGHAQATAVILHAQLLAEQKRAALAQRAFSALPERAQELVADALQAAALAEQEEERLQRQCAQAQHTVVCEEDGDGEERAERAAGAGSRAAGGAGRNGATSQLLLLTFDAAGRYEAQAQEAAEAQEAAAAQEAQVAQAQAAQAAQPAQAAQAAQLAQPAQGGAAGEAAGRGAPENGFNAQQPAEGQQPVAAGQEPQARVEASGCRRGLRKKLLRWSVVGAVAALAGAAAMCVRPGAGRARR